MAIVSEIQTLAFGTIKVTESQKYTFPEGLAGLEDIKEFYLIEENQSLSTENPQSDDDDEAAFPFVWLQSKEYKEIAFVMVNPYFFKHDFKLVVNKSDFDAIGLTEADSETGNLEVYTIVTLSENAHEMTANLLGPIILNKEKGLGRQAMSMYQYTTKHNILMELLGTDKYYDLYGDPLEIGNHNGNELDIDNGRST